MVDPGERDDVSTRTLTGRRHACARLSAARQHMLHPCVALQTDMLAAACHEFALAMRGLREDELSAAEQSLCATIWALLQIGDARELWQDDGWALARAEAMSAEERSDFARVVVELAARLEGE